MERTSLARTSETADNESTSSFSIIGSDEECAPTSAVQEKDTDKAASNIRNDCNGEVERFVKVTRKTLSPGYKFDDEQSVKLIRKYQRPMFTVEGFEIVNEEEGLHVQTAKKPLRRTTREVSTQTIVEMSRPKCTLDERIKKGHYFVLIAYLFGVMHFTQAPVLKFYWLYAPFTFFFLVSVLFSHWFRSKTIFVLSMMLCTAAATVHFIQICFVFNGILFERPFLSTINLFISAINIKADADIFDWYIRRLNQKFLE